MGIGKQSKTLNKSQIQMIRTFLRSKRNGLRNETIFLLSVKGGMRSVEISKLQWNMILNSDGEIGDYIHLPNSSSKGNNGGRIIPINKDLKSNLIEYFKHCHKFYGFDKHKSFVVRTERSPFTTSQTIINMFSCLVSFRHHLGGFGPEMYPKLGNGPLTFFRQAGTLESAKQPTKNFEK